MMTDAAALQARLDAMEKRLAQAEDREAIWRLFMAMQAAIDNRDLKAYGEGFTEDGVWAGVVGRGVGPVGIAEILGQYMKPWDSEATRTWHVTLDVLIDIDGDSATASSKFQHITPAENGTLRVWHLGAYDDRLVRTAQGWKFTQRLAYVIVPYMEPKFQRVGTGGE
ncbi:nuclear transport factor 2 family protein [Sphingomonas sp. MMS24-J13]|uniref:nuclear transport factor 2 family protein n=1 Tax=Sphingomonas sp. MMS24-J13 TaxID=3238686 RepID=UPI00384FF78D